ncbi:MAG: autotransporter domain-containing protein [Alphaproteobacteria bacterium]|nr:autotransporter domain-containing protein [Alphaproteobacteria bacterium]
MSNIKHLADLVKICSVLPVFVAVPALASETIQITAGNTYRIVDDVISGADVEGAMYSAAGAPEYVKDTDLAQMYITGSKFSDNKTSWDDYEVGVLAARKNSKITVRDSEFIGNNADYYSAVTSATHGTNVKGGELDIRGTTFKNNSALAGGAVGGFSISTFDDVHFVGNKATDASDGGAGALFLGSVSKTKIFGSEFSNNESASVGGAIAMRSTAEGDNKLAKLDIIETDFTGNSAATQGGAIYSTFYDSENVKDAVYLNDVDFVKNSAKEGGAIYTVNSKDKSDNLASMRIVGGDFEHNIADVAAGAIWNGSKLVINDTDFEYNTSADYAGAIYNKGSLSIDGDVDFVGNASATGGGAVYNGYKATINTLDADFVSNYAKGDTSSIVSGGALYNGGKIASVIGEFKNNSVIALGEDATSKGGALYSWANRAESASIDSIVADFLGNKASSLNGAESVAIGGAIVNDGIIGSLRQLKNGFMNNTVDAGYIGYAGALYNSEFARIGELVADFTGNSNNSISWAMGGAVTNKGNIEYLSGRFVNNGAMAKNDYALGGVIYNSTNTGEVGTLAEVTIADSEFRNNYVSSGSADFAFGGAIYNDIESVVNLSGVNTFAGNMANGIANDIYNDGDLNVVSGVTTIDGGITGEGQLTIANGAKLDIGTTALEQASVTVDGVLAMSLRDATTYAKILTDDLKTQGDGKLLFAIGSVGNYDVFQSDVDVNIDAGSVYDVTKDGTSIVVKTKKAEVVAAESGMKVDTASTLVALANHENEKMRDVSLALQRALVSEDVAKVQKEAGKLKPAEVPVAQSVATSTQGQAMTLAAGRMSGFGAIGRNAGDANIDYGFWGQGLFNKSKNADKFTGYTRGIALGFDAQVNHDFLIGVGYTYNNTDIDVNDRDTDIDSNTLFLYAQYKPTQWFVNGTVSYTMADYTEDINVAGVGLSADYNVDSFGAQAMIGYDYATGLTPEVGARYMHVSQDTYNNGFADIKSKDVDTLSGIAGLKYAFEIQSNSQLKWRPELRAAATYDFVADDAFATIVIPGTNPYTVMSERLSRFGGEFGIGLTALYNGVELSLNYDLDLHEDYTSQTGMARFRYEF